MRHPPVVLGIVGKPVAGRHSLAAGIVQWLGGEARVARLSFSDYRKYDQNEGLKQALTEAHPGAVRLDMVEQHLSLLKRGEAVLRPTYNRQRGVFEPAAYLEPRPFVIIDGELGFFSQGLRNNMDLRVFYGSDAPVAEWPGTLAGDAEAYLESQRKWADLVMESLTPAGGVALTLRPTLPRLALQELIQGVGEQQRGMRLELARDMGLPVDRIVIDAGISSKAAAHYKKRLQAEIPGEYRQGNGGESGPGRQSQSESLVLTQLLVVLHLLKIAGG